MSKQLFDISYFKKKVFSVADYNNKKNVELKNNIKNLELNEVDSLYTLLEQYKESKVNKNLLNIISSKIEFEKYNIKGICQKYNSSFSSINNYTECMIDKKKYNFTFVLYKIFNKENNKISISEQAKYTIILLNINEDDKKYLEKNLINFQRSALLFTNLVAKLELDNITNQFQFVFKSTLNTKIYMEKNNEIDLKKSKNNFVPSGIYIDYLKSNEFTYIDYISTKIIFVKKFKIQR